MSARHFTGFCFALGISLALALFVSCSFDYSEGGAADDNEPDITMEQVEYTRFRGGELDLRFSAGEARRYEKKQLMELDDFSFEQYNAGQDGEGGTIAADVTGSGGSAVVELGPGNVRISEGVRIRVDSEDIRIETSNLAWKNEERLLEGGQGSQVLIERSDGTMMKGRSFSADIRRRTWEFGDGIEGTYVHEDETTDAAGEDADEEADNGAGPDSMEQ
ncbi:MAG: LPS export ABC transporter periplasmic protein LptC [Spirochaetaceae bacterium]|jgi:LPS export ABC transporter protein LptC|nr:LPS export ABC transporter periplasmic protein LptC [Spirochaetaceae bacterium]